MKTRQTLTLISASAACLALSSQALAQEPTTRPRQAIQGAAPGFDQRQPTMNLILNLDTSFRLQGDLQDSTGDVSIFRTGMGVTITTPIAERNRLSITLGSEQAWYNFSSNAQIIPGNPQPWDHIQSYTVGGNFSTQWSEKISSFVLGSVNFAGEGSAAFNNGFTGGGGGGIIYKLAEGLDLTAGVFVRSKLGGGVYVFPIVGIDWHINKEWRLSNENQPGLYLSYQPSENWRFSAGARYDYSEFRLADDNFVPSGIGSDERVPATFGVDWTPAPNFTLQGRVGAMLFQKLKERDSDRATLGSTDIDIGLYLSGGIVLRF